MSVASIRGTARRHVCCCKLVFATPIKPSVAPLAGSPPPPEYREGEGGEPAIWFVFEKCHVDAKGCARDSTASQ